MPPRLRQAVLAAPSLDPVVAELRAELGAGEPYADPGVGVFGLENAVMALGDQFLEVVAPVAVGTAVGRHLERRGPGGYMLIFQVEDLAAVRARAEAAGVRVVWEIALDDIATIHLHPADMGCIVSLDAPIPPESWRWAGPEWTGKAGSGPPGRLTGATISALDHEAMHARWRAILGADPPGITFVPGEGGLVEVSLAVPGREGTANLGGLTFTLAP